MLKDAAATSMYGAQGANGVVIITTKSGKKGQGTVTYNGKVGFGFLNRKLDLLDADEYMEVQRRAYAYSGKVMPHLETPYENLFYYAKDPAGNFQRDENGYLIASPKYDTDWQEALTQTAITNDHTVSFASGNDKTSVYSSIAYQNFEGLVKYTNSERMTGTVNVKSDITDWLNVQTVVTAGTDKTNAADGESGFGQGPVRNMLEMPPIVPVRYEDGTWGRKDDYPLGELAENPLRLLQDRNRLRDLQRHRRHPPDQEADLHGQGRLSDDQPPDAELRQGRPARRDRHQRRLCRHRQHQVAPLVERGLLHLCRLVVRRPAQVELRAGRQLVLQPLGELVGGFGAVLRRLLRLPQPRRRHGLSQALVGHEPADDELLLLPHEPHLPRQVPAGLHAARRRRLELRRQQQVRLVPLGLGGVDHLRGALLRRGPQMGEQPEAARQLRYGGQRLDPQLQHDLAVQQRPDDPQRRAEPLRRALEPRQRRPEVGDLEAVQRRSRRLAVRQPAGADHGLLQQDHHRPAFPETGRDTPRRGPTWARSATRVSSSRSRRAISTTRISSGRPTSSSRPTGSW